MEKKEIMVEVRSLRAELVKVKEERSLINQRLKELQSELKDKVEALREL
jgi:uncharacterized protein (DUF3084 family)